MRSTRSSSRGRISDQRGFAVIAAIALAVLFFAMIQLILIDASRELAEARRFRSRVLASVLAENGAELAAYGITEDGSMYATPSAENSFGKISGTLMKSEHGEFVIEGKGTTGGLAPASAWVKIIGEVEGQRIRIYYATHKP